MNFYADTKDGAKGGPNKPSSEIIELLKMVNLVTMRERNFPELSEVAYWSARFLINPDLKVEEIRFIEDLPDESDYYDHTMQEHEFNNLLDDHGEEYEKRTGNSLWSAHLTATVLQIRDIVEPFPELSAFVIKGEVWEVYDVRKAYHKFVSYRKNLYHLIEQSKIFPEGTDVLDNFELSVSVEIINGQFEFSLPEFAQIIRGIPVERLSICPVCDRIFWVYDLRQKRCSAKCSNRHSKRQQRANPEKLKEINDARKLSYRARQKNNPFSKIARAEKIEIEKHQKWRERRDRNFNSSVRTLRPSPIGYQD